MEKFLLLIFVSNFLCGFIPIAAFETKRNREFFTIHYLEDKRIVPVRIILNSEQKTEHVRSSRGGETLYDFNQGKVAYKDANLSQCFIADIAEESLEADREKLKLLKNGIVRGYYIPTFIILEEFVSGTRLLKTAGDRLSQFCDGSDVYLVERKRHRRKRATSDEKGQFTHHSYGHYGHQSNNYAHYGHETYITGKTDKDGQIRSQGISHQQVKSEGSQGYPHQSLRNGQSGGPSVSTMDSRTSISSPQYQNQYQMPNYQQALGGNGRNTGMGGSGQFSLQTGHESGYQLNLPLGLKTGNAYRSGIRSSGQYGVGGLQPQLSTEFQRYPGYIPSTPFRTGDQITHSQVSPQISSMAGRSFPSTTVDQAGLTAEEQARVRQRTTIPGYQDFDSTKVAHRLPGLPATGLEPSLPYSPALTLDRRPPQQPGTDTADIQTGTGTFMPISKTHGVDKIDYDSHDRKYKDQTGHIPSEHHRLPPRTDGLGIQTTLYHPGSGIPTRGIQAPAFTPGAGISSMQIPSRRIHEPGITGLGSVSGIQTPGFYTDSGIPSIQRPDGLSALPGQILPGTQTIGAQQYIPESITTTQQLGQIPGVTFPIGDTRKISQVPLIYPPSTISGQIYPESTHTSQPVSTIPGSGAQRYIAGSIRPMQQLDQIPGITYQNGGSKTRSQVPLLHPPSKIPGQIYPGSAHTFHPVSTVPGSQTFVPGFAVTHDQTASRTRYPDSPYYPQTIRGTGTDYTRGITPSQASTVPQDIRSSQISRGQSVDRQFIPGVTGPIPPDGTRVYQEPGTSRQDSTVLSTRDSGILSRGTDARLIQPGDRQTTSQTGGAGLGLYGQDSVSSQTQIQTGLEGTAGEAAAAGQYRGLGSQTQVQGGYAGNGSFSAQAQSGFTGGVVQSQVQGSKLGGLSGSSSQVERVGSAQSQVQVGQPSGAASSTAQGRFSGGTTQVQAQSGKTGGSAGAQAQSTGLSSSHVQVNIGGNDISDKDRFQGTVSASVQGGHSSGQSQTQLQGGYESGRTYAATAQGGFDSLQGFQGSVPQIGSLTELSNGISGIGQFPSTIKSQVSQQAINGRPVAGSVAQRIPTGTRFDETQTSQISPIDQTIDRRVYARPGGIFPDQRPLPQIPPQQIADVIHQTSFPTRAEGSRIQYPSSEILSNNYSSHQLARQPDYPAIVGGVPTGITSGRGVPIQPDVPGYEGYSIDGPRIGVSQISDHGTRLKQPTPQLPITSGQDISHAARFSPGVSPDLSYLSQIARTPQHPTQHQYLQQPTAGIFPQVHPPSPIFGLPYKPSYPSGSIPQLQGPDLAIDQLPHVYGYPPGFAPQQPDSPATQIPHMPGYPTGSVPQSLRPDSPIDQGLHAPGYPTGSISQPHGPGKTLDQLPHVPDYLPGVIQQPQISSLGTGMGQPGSTPTFQTGLYPFQPPPLFPGEHQISPPFSQTVSSSHRPDGVPSPAKPDAIHPPPLQPGVQATLPSPMGQPQTRLVPPQISQPSLVTAGQPGVSEPDESNCCKALRDLKRRCCNGASQNNGASSSCCKSTDQDDIFDFSSDDKLDEKSDGQCKVVKAICYIVYKPIGKARVCKPTQTNGC